MRFQPVEPFTRPRGHAHNRATKLPAERAEVDFDTPTSGRFDHVDDKNRRATLLQYLPGNEQSPLQIGSIDHDQNRVGHLIGGSEHKVSRDDLFR